MAKAETGRSDTSSGVSHGGIGTSAAGAGATDNLKVFISYSRKDSEAFADELAGGLDLHGGFDVSLDRHSIVEGEEWKRRLGGLIADADTVVFIISPGSSSSPVCQWEVDEAARLSKRILPVLWQAPGETTPIPERLAALNYTRFDGGRSFIAGVKALAAALNTDLAWLREHTRLLARAMEWDRGSRSDNRLMSGNDVTDAKAWAARRPVNAPELTALHLDFIRASENADTARQDTARRQLEDMAASQTARSQALADREAAVRKLSRRTTVGLIGMGGLTAATGGLSYWGYLAERRFRDERLRAMKAEAASVIEAVRREAARTDIAGQLVAYATAPGLDSLSGTDGLSPFTEITLAELQDAMASVQSALSSAGAKVAKRASEKYDGFNQRPYLSTDMNANIYLKQQPESRRRDAVIVSGPDTFDKVDGVNKFTLTGAGQRDAQAWAEFLKGSGFSVTSLNYPSKQQFLDAIGPPNGGQVDQIQLRVFFYAGLGATLSGEVHLIASDTFCPEKFRGDQIEKFEETTATAKEIQARLRNAAAASIMILDTSLRDPRPLDEQLRKGPTSAARSAPIDKPATAQPPEPAPEANPQPVAR